LSRQALCGHLTALALEPRLAKKSEYILTTHQGVRQEDWQRSQGLAEWFGLRRAYLINLSPVGVGSQEGFYPHGITRLQKTLCILNSNEHSIMVFYRPGYAKDGYFTLSG